MKWAIFSPFVAVGIILLQTAPMISITEFWEGPQVTMTFPKKHFRNEYTPNADCVTSDKNPEWDREHDACNARLTALL
jgi:hypothetical protein